MTSAGNHWKASFCEHY